MMKLLAKRLCLAALLPLILLELLLQVGALLAWRADPGTQEVMLGPHSQVVLCVGDSFTAGLGSSGANGSYPAQLEPILQDQLGPSWKAINCGRPGRDSRELLKLLGGQLETYRPRAALVLVGVNDQWNRPDRYQLDGSSGSGPVKGTSFRWTWRTWRLFKLARSVLFSHELRGSDLARELPSEPQPKMPEAEKRDLRAGIAGRWQIAGVPARFLSDGRASIGSLRMTWTLSGERLTLEGAGGQRHEIQLQSKEDEILLWAGNRPQPMVMRPLQRPSGHASGKKSAVNERKRNLAATARAARECGDHETVVLRFNELLPMLDPGDPSEVWIRRALIEAHLGLGESDRAKEQAEIMRRIYRENPTRRNGEALLGTLTRVGDGRGALALARVFVTEHPDSAWGWCTLAWQSYLRGDMETARASIDRAVQADTEEAPSIYLRRARLLLDENPLESIKSVVKFFYLEPDEDETRRVFMVGRGQYTEELLAQALDSVPLSSTEREAIERLFRESTSDSLLGTFAVLRDHLRQFSSLCRRHNVLPVFMSYPGNSRVNDVLESVAEKTGAGWVDLRPVFGKELQTRKKQELFVRDGHCNDEGYGVMARELGDWLVQRFGSQPGIEESEMDAPR